MGKVVTVYGPKGGVGTTTITLALARVLAGAHKVVVVEVDFTPGDMAAILDLELRMGGDVQRPAGETFDVLTGGLPDEGERVTHERMLALVGDLKENYDYVLIDTQSYLTEGVVAALRAADKLLIVTDESLASVARVLGITDYLKGNSFADLGRASLVLSRTRFAGGKFVAATEFSMPVAGRMPEFARFGGYRDKRLPKLVGDLV